MNDRLSPRRLPDFDGIYSLFFGQDGPGGRYNLGRAAGSETWYGGQGLGAGVGDILDNAEAMLVQDGGRGPADTW